MEEEWGGGVGLTLIRHRPLTVNQNLMECVTPFQVPRPGSESGECDWHVSVVVVYLLFGFSSLCLRPFTFKLCSQTGQLSGLHACAKKHNSQKKLWPRFHHPTQNYPSLLPVYNNFLSFMALQVHRVTYICPENLHFYFMAPNIFHKFAFFIS